MPKPKPSSQAPSAGRKRRGRLRALSASLPGVTKRAFARRGLLGADLARQWPAIVGADLAERCRPRKLRFPRPGEALDGDLTLRVAPAWALEIQHLEALLLERINSFFGYRAVARLILQQGPLPAGDRAARPEKDVGDAAESVPLGLDDSDLTARLAEVADPALREALEGLARSLRQKQAKRAKRA